MAGVAWDGWALRTTIQPWLFAVGYVGVKYCRMGSGENRAVAMIEAKLNQNDFE
jgi:hypothetical protein